MLHCPCCLWAGYHQHTGDVKLLDNLIQVLTCKLNSINRKIKPWGTLHDWAHASDFLDWKDWNHFNTMSLMGGARRLSPLDAVFTSVLVSAVSGGLWACELTSRSGPDIVCTFGDWFYVNCRQVSQSSDYNCFENVMNGFFFCFTIVCGISPAVAW